MEMNTDIPSYILDLPLEKANAEIIRLTRNSKDYDKSDRFNSMYNKNGALHVKHEDIGSYRGSLQGVMLRCFRRCVWIQQWAIHHYGKDFDGKRARLDQYVRSAAKIYARCAEAMFTLDQRSEWFLNRSLEENNWLGFSDARFFVQRARERHNQNPDTYKPCNVQAKHVVAQAKRQGDNTCPVFGYECSRQQGGKPKDNSLSLHRVDSSKGYEPDNIWLVSARANALIRDMSSLELSYIADRYEDRGDTRYKTYRQLAEGQAYMERQLNIDPVLRERWNVGHALWITDEEGEIYRAYD